MQVDGISYDKDETSLITVTTTAGDNFVADYVLVSLPLVSLKQQTIKFTPPLPDWKMQAINRLGVGLLEKVCIIEICDIYSLYPVVSLLKLSLVSERKTVFMSSGFCQQRSTQRSPTRPLDRHLVTRIALQHFIRINIRTSHISKRS
jgi:hypothetical protein